MAPWNAVVASTKHIAEQYIKAFNIGDEVWEGFGVGESIRGRGFDRVVMIRPHWNMGSYEILEFEKEIDHWRTRLQSPSATLVLV